MSDLERRNYDTPRQRYMNDPQFRNLVEYMESHIRAANFTPSEMREAAVLASINYEMSRHRRSIDPPVRDAIKTLEQWLDKGEQP